MIPAHSFCSYGAVYKINGGISGELTCLLYKVEGVVMNGFLIRKKRIKRNNRRAQVALELSFSVIGTVLIILGTIRLFIWSGQDLIGRLSAHRTTLYEDVSGSYDGVLNQIRPHFYRDGIAPFEPSVKSEIFGGNRPFD